MTDSWEEALHILKRRDKNKKKKENIEEEMLKRK